MVHVNAIKILRNAKVVSFLQYAFNWTWAALSLLISTCKLHCTGLVYKTTKFICFRVEINLLPDSWD